MTVKRAESRNKVSKGAYIKRISEEEIKNSYLFETAWEVCNQVGGIFTVIKSKVPAVLQYWDHDNYILLGPYIPENADAIFEHFTDANDPVSEAVEEMNKNGTIAHYGTWLTEGRPKVVLFDISKTIDQLDTIKYLYWEHHNIDIPINNILLDQTILFGNLVQHFFKLFTANCCNDKLIITHFHEWMGATAIPEIRRDKLPLNIVFTTHATMLGRYLAMNDPNFYDNLSSYNWSSEAKHFNIEAIVNLERAATHGAHVFTTVSGITGEECKYLLGREPDLHLPNGLNIKRFEALHEFQNLHLTYKDKINEFVLGHFFQSYSFDLDKTLYFFTSGRFEYKNKGYDLTLEALARLNYKLKEAKSDTTVVMFFITRNPVHGYNPEVLEHKALLEEIQRDCDTINQTVAAKLFYNIASNEKGFSLPNLNDLLNDYSVLRLRQNFLSWKTNNLPPVITHNLVDENNDPVMNFLKVSKLLNLKEDRVKIVYHPDFVASSNPLFRMDYLQFIRGCNLGIFPSYYEPWGYTPLECSASGIPSVTSDLAGFGSYVKSTFSEPEKMGLYVLNRKNISFEESAENLANLLFRFIRLNRRERITQRNKVEASSVQFDWNRLGKYYLKAYGKAIKGKKPKTT